MILRRGARTFAVGLLTSLTLAVLAGASCGTAAQRQDVVATAPVSPTPGSAEPAEPTTTPSLENPQIPLPPDARLAVEGGDPVTGELGSFSWANTGSGSPWLPGSPMRVGRGEVLFMALSEPVGLKNWTVARTPGSTPGTDIEGVAEGVTGVVRFPAPPVGIWSVSVDVWFANGLGSAAYYWLVEVE